MTVFAHAGHWAVQLLYAAPIVVMLVMLLVGKVRHARDGDRDDPPLEDNDYAP